MHRILSILLCFFLLGAGGQNMDLGPSHHRAIVSSGCTDPTSQMTYQFLPSSGCSNTIKCLNDAVGGNSATTTTSSAPSYSATGGPNGLPDISYNGTSNTLGLATTVAGTSTLTLTIAVVMNVTAFQSNPDMIFGPSGSVGWGYGLENSSGGGLYAVFFGNTIVGSSTAAPPTAAWVAAVITYNGSTGAGTFYNISGGSYSMNGTFTQTESWSSNTGSVGWSHNASAYFFDGKMAEFTVKTGVAWSTTQVGSWATWVLCHHGV
jgi:hypothetical protein